MLLTLIFALCPGVPRLLVGTENGSPGDLKRWFCLPLNVLICVSFGLSAETYPYLDTYTNNVDQFLTVLEGVSGLMWRGFREFGGLIFFSENDVF